MLNSKIKHIHFIGICGTLMASIAVLLKKRGFQITGSDENIYPPMSTFLEENDIPILNGYREDNLISKPELIVIGNAISRGNEELEMVLEQDTRYISVSELLREFFIRGKKSIVVTGTHGKTTTTSLLAWVFECGGKQPGFMIAGIPPNFGLSCREGNGEFFITEGDEYDTAFFDKRSKFFHYHPKQLIINNIEFDHADIFNSLDDILKSFRLMLRLLPRNGVIVVNGDDDNAMNVVESAYCPYITFGFSEKCEVKAKVLDVLPSGTKFHVDWPNQCSTDFHIPLFGQYNVSNALSTITLALYNGISIEAIQKAFDQFCNVKRRQELRGVRKGIHIYDDFAHHPTAVKGTIQALRQKHPQHRLIAVFEPRSNTSILNINQAELTDSFEEADLVLFAPLHRVDRIPLEKRLNIKNMVSDIKAKNKEVIAFDSIPEIVDYLISHAHANDTILIMSNGKFGNIHQLLLDQL